jgi:4-hydroxy-3-methylbut-2-enyl diphosphate reductase
MAMAQAKGQLMDKKPLKVLLAKPRGFCAGVVRAVDIVERALEKFGEPVYVRHEIVHNKHVVQALKNKGAIFVEEVDEIPEGAVTIFSAHGVSNKVETDAAGRRLEVIDATCPLVSKVHKEAQRYSRQGYEIVLIGHRGHPEVEGTMGQVPGTVHLVSTLDDVAKLEPTNRDKLAYVTQTTLSVDDTRHIIEALRKHFPKIVGPDVKDICYATQNRQSVVREMAQSADVILVIGANYSSNSNRLREIGQEAGIPSYLLADASTLDPAWLVDAKTVGITAGASAPEDLVQGLIARLGELFDVDVQDLETVQENIQFNLPRELAETV